MKLKLEKIGEDIVLIIPQNVLDMLGVGEGDDLYLVAVPGGYRISRAEPDDLEALPDGTLSKSTIRRRNAVRGAS